MLLTSLNAVAVALLASCTLANLTTPATERAEAGRGGGCPVVELAGKAEEPPEPGGDGGVRGEGRIFTSDGDPVYVNVDSTDPGADRNFIWNFAAVNMLPEIKRVRGVGTAAILGRREYVMRIELNPDRMRAHDLSPEEIRKAFRGCSLIGSAERLVAGPGRSGEYELTHTGRFNKTQPYEDIILKANADGEILRLRDVGRVELASSFVDFSSEVDGHPAATIVLKPAPGSDATAVIESVRERLKRTKEESFPPGMEFRVVPLDSRNMVCAALQCPRDSTLEVTIAGCRELGAIAKGVDGITSVSSLAGYQIRTEGRDSEAGTCLIHWEDRADRRRTSRQIIEALEERCRTMKVEVEFFEPPAASVLVAAGGFSVRVLDRANSDNGAPPGRVPELFMDDLLKHESLQALFHTFAHNYPQYELTINNDVARQKGVSIADAIEGRFKVAGGDVEGEPKSRRLVEDFSRSSFRGDRGEMVPYSSFLQLKMKRGPNEVDR